MSNSDSISNYFFVIDFFFFEFLVYALTPSNLNLNFVYAYDLNDSIPNEFSGYTTRHSQSHTKALDNAMSSFMFSFLRRISMFHGRPYT